MPKQVTTDDVPLEYNGSQAVIYKSPEGAILYFDDFSYEQKVVLRDCVGQTLEFDTYGGNDGKLYKTTTLKVDKDNYIKLEPDLVTLCISGVIRVYDKDHMPGTGGGGSGDAKTIIWE